MKDFWHVINTLPQEQWPPLYSAIQSLILGGVIVGALLSAAGYLVLLERKVLAWMQHRVGPNRCGPFGLLQPLADVLKLLTKEDSLPPFVDKWLFIAAPAIIMLTAILSLAVVPFGQPQWLVVKDLNVGILFFLALSSLGVYSIVLAGWSSNSKYAALGGLRATAQMISYELSMSMSLLAAVMLAGSLSLNKIVEAQSSLWFVILQPLGFVIFVISVIAESRRAPFDLPEAENEIVAGFHTEYSSMKFALFFLGEYVAVVLLSFVISTIYLGGYHGLFDIPYIPAAIEGPIWLLAKVGFFIFFFIWIRATYPRFRYDHLMELGWKYMIPLSVLNLIATAVLIILFPTLGGHK
ncbi:MAG: NADH-quinone oxidoreductase subunit NuoH [Candidatus Sumerlaeaceae bacterium]|nr:NADH-quinone oxidoreductase subunit NuoH [Candidatus Sumerlaeaceae bacterium]